MSRLTLELPASRGDRIREAIQQAILDGTLPQGAALVEREIAESLGVSKTPVREALKQLQSSGLVVTSPYQGAAVRRIDEATARGVAEARLSVEPAAVRRGVERLGPGPRPAAREALSRAAAISASVAPAQRGLANRAFHRELYLSSDNEWLIAFLDKLQTLSTFLATAGWRVEPTFDEEAEEHRRILDAVEAGDGPAAEALTVSHIERASQALLRSLAAPSDTAAEAGR